MAENHIQELGIESNPGVCGGDPCIRGTRIPVSCLLDWRCSGHTPEETASEYKDLSVKQIEYALWWADEYGFTAAWRRAQQRSEQAQDEDEEELYYILDTRTVVGNCALFWRPNARGYCCDINEAGLYTRAEAESHRETDVAVPFELVRRLSSQHCRLDWISQSMKLPRGGCR